MSTTTREPLEGRRRHKLMPVEVQKELPPIRSQDGKGMDAIVHLKLFCPYGRATYYITEGERLADGDWQLFGYCVSPLGEDCDELSYMSLMEMAETEISLGGVKLPAIERDCYFSGIGKTIRECLEDT